MLPQPCSLPIKPHYTGFWSVAAQTRASWPLILVSSNRQVLDSVAMTCSQTLIAVVIWFHYNWCFIFIFLPLILIYDEIIVRVSKTVASLKV